MRRHFSPVLVVLFDPLMTHPKGQCWGCSSLLWHKLFVLGVKPGVTILILEDGDVLMENCGS